MLISGCIGAPVMWLNSVHAFFIFKQKRHKNKKNTFALWLFFLSIALILQLFFYETPLSYFIKFIVSKWIYSTSNASVLFLLFTVSLICLRTYFLKGRTETTASAMCFFLITLAIALGSNFLMVITYYTTHHIPFSAHVYHWSGKENSFTSLMHSHQGKLFFAYLHKIIHIDVSKYEIGNAFLNDSKSNAVFYLFVTGVILAFFSALMLVHRMSVRIKEEPAKIVCYTLAIINLLKNMIDGGLLNYPTLPSLLVLLCVHSRVPALITITSGFIFQITLYLIIIQDKDIYFFSNLLFLNSTYLFLLLFDRKEFFTTLTKLICICYLAFNLTLDFKSSLLPLFEWFNPTLYTVYSCHQTCKPIDPANLNNLRIYEVYKTLHDSPFKTQNTLITPSNTNHLYMSDAYFFMINPLHFKGNRGDLSAKDSFSIHKSHLGDNGWIQFKIKNSPPLNRLFHSQSDSILNKNNYYVYLKQLNQFYQKAGFYEYILLGYSFTKTEEGF